MNTNSSSQETSSTNLSAMENQLEELKQKNDKLKEEQNAVVTLMKKEMCHSEQAVKTQECAVSYAQLASLAKTQHEAAAYTELAQHMHARAPKQALLADKARRQRLKELQDPTLHNQSIPPSIICQPSHMPNQPSLFVKHVLPFVTESKDRFNMMLVCKEWNRQLHTPAAWRFVLSMRLRDDIGLKKVTLCRNEIGVHVDARNLLVDSLVYSIDRKSLVYLDLCQLQLCTNIQTLIIENSHWSLDSDGAETFFHWMDLGRLTFPCLTTIVLSFLEEVYDYCCYDAMVEKWNDLLNTTLAGASKVRIEFPTITRGNEDEATAQQKKELKDRLTTFLSNHASKFVEIEFWPENSLKEFLLTICTQFPPRELHTFSLVTSDVSDKQIITEFLNTQDKGSLKELNLTIDENAQYWTTAVLQVLVALNDSVVTNLEHVIICGEATAPDVQMSAELMIDAARQLGKNRCPKLKKLEIRTRVKKQLTFGQLAAIFGCFAPETTSATQRDTHKPLESEVKLRISQLKFPPTEIEGDEVASYEALTADEFSTLLQQHYSGNKFNGRVGKETVEPNTYPRYSTFTFNLNDQRIQTGLMYYDD